LTILVTVSSSGNHNNNNTHAHSHLHIAFNVKIVCNTKTNAQTQEMLVSQFYGLLSMSGGMSLSRDAATHTCYNFNYHLRDSVTVSQQRLSPHILMTQYIYKCANIWYI